MSYLTPAQTQNTPVIPPKIQAALSFIHFCEQVQHATIQTVSGSPEKIGRKLTSGEQRCYDAAITTMTEYFNADGFGDEPPRNPPGGGNSPTPPQAPVLNPA